MLRTEKLRARRLLEESEQVVVKARHIQHAHGLIVKGELLPRQRLEQLLIRPDPAGQRHEAIA